MFTPCSYNLSGRKDCKVWSMALLLNVLIICLAPAVIAWLGSVIIPGHFRVYISALFQGQFCHGVVAAHRYVMCGTDINGLFADFTIISFFGMIMWHDYVLPLQDKIQYKALCCNII